MKILGSICLAAGFLTGAYVTVSQVDSVHWGYYGACAAAMLVGMVMLRMVRSTEMKHAGGKHDADIVVLRESIVKLIDKVKSFEAAASDEEQLSLHHKIDAELTEDINAFVEARESMIPKLGMQCYADIMSPFANGERLINRAWSASVDGYVDEVRRCIASARTQFERAQKLLAVRT